MEPVERPVDEEAPSTFLSGDSHEQTQAVDSSLEHIPDEAPPSRHSRAPQRQRQNRAPTGKLERIATFLYLEGCIVWMVALGKQNQQRSGRDGLVNNDETEEGDDDAEMARWLIIMAFCSLIASALVETIVDCTVAGERPTVHSIYGTMGMSLNLFQAILFTSGAVMQGLAWARVWELEQDGCLERATIGVGSSCLSSYQTHLDINLFATILWDMNALITLTVLGAGFCCSKKEARYGCGNVWFAVASALLTVNALVWRRHTDQEAFQLQVLQWISTATLSLGAMINFILEEQSAWACCLTSNL